MGVQPWLGGWVCIPGRVAGGHPRVVGEPYFARRREAWVVDDMAFALA